MIKYNFELRKDKVTKDGLMPIRILFRIDGSVIKRNTKYSCREIDWFNNRVKSKTKNGVDYGQDEINDELSEIEKKISDISLYFRANKIKPTKELFIEKFDAKVEIVVGNEFDFFKCFEAYIEKGKLIKAPNTIKGQITVKNYLRDFCEEKDIKISFENIDKNLFEQLMEYSYLEKEIKQNYFAKIIKVLKSFLNWATEEEFNKKREYEKFKAPEHDIDIVYLTWEELMKLYKKEFENPTYDKVRDIYCFGVFTSLRFSDLSKLHLANITDEHLTISIQKTKTQNHTIKLNKYAKEILAKYKGTIYEPLPTISHQKFNDYIKKCCELAEIDNPFTIHWFVGAKKKSLTAPKWQFISAHTSRKTHITQSLLRGMSLDVLKKNANITKEKTLEKYAKYTQAFLDEQMDKAWNN